ncbi:hypothetical protein QOZ80_1BG0075550 [Eleusine coracana subsp. coracana]|nr:hypothetical protein QOZ80_1BG0075550 [Eleusine coracana subsp. coracana]
MEVVTPAHVVLLASPGAGNFIPVAELARRIVTHRSGLFRATLVTYTNFSSANHASCLASLPPSLRLHHFSLGALRRCQRFTLPYMVLSSDNPDGSVLYVCFGSGGTLSTKQTAELAAGLEASGQRFLWVVRFPRDTDSSASFFGSGRGDDPVSYLPDGFVERTNGIGLCVSCWVPQLEILNHRAVGGFLSHCGWNSTLEAVAAGVPTLAWSLYAEQRMNAVMLSQRVGLALRPMTNHGEINDEGVVISREEIASAVMELMVGDKGHAAREKARELREAAATAWAPDGPSRKAFEVVAGKWTKTARALR